VNETYLKVRGRWCYLYQAIDRNGDLVDTMLSEHRDMAAAKAFFRSARSATSLVPDKVTTNGHGSYPQAIHSTLGKLVTHLKRILRLDQLRLRGPCGARDEFHLAAAAQNLRKLAKAIPASPAPQPA
jgi:transposase-like protein